MEERHLQSVVALDNKIALRPWTREMFLEELRLQSFCRILQGEEGMVLGYGITRLQLDEWHLLTVGVAPGFRRRGYGARLLTDIIEKAAKTASRSVLLEVRASNKGALNLYKKLGFKVLYVREGYYKSVPSTEDALVMDRRVSEGDRDLFS